MYGKLVLDVDRRVRLVANQVHALITANAKKRLAPLLKEFIGPWLLSKYDLSKDVAKVAQSSFEVRIFNHCILDFLLMQRIDVRLFFQQRKD